MDRVGRRSSDAEDEEEYDTLHDDDHRKYLDFRIVSILIVAVSVLLAILKTLITQYPGCPFNPNSPVPPYSAYNISSVVLTIGIWPQMFYIFLFSAAPPMHKPLTAEPQNIWIKLLYMMPATIAYFVYNLRLLAIITPPREALTAAHKYGCTINDFYTEEEDCRLAFRWNEFVFKRDAIVGGFVILSNLPKCRSIRDIYRLIAYYWIESFYVFSCGIYGVLDQVTAVFFGIRFTIGLDPNISELKRAIVDLAFVLFWSNFCVVTMHKLKKAYLGLMNWAEIKIFKEELAEDTLTAPAWRQYTSVRAPGKERYAMFMNMEHDFYRFCYGRLFLTNVSSLAVYVVTWLKDVFYTMFHFGMKYEESFELVHLELFHPTDPITLNGFLRWLLFAVERLYLRPLSAPKQLISLYFRTIDVAALSDDVKANIEARRKASAAAAKNRRRSSLVGSKRDGGVAFMKIPFSFNNERIEITNVPPVFRRKKQSFLDTIQRRGSLANPDTAAWMMKVVREIQFHVAKRFWIRQMIKLSVSFLLVGLELAIIIARAANLPIAYNTRLLATYNDRQVKTTFYLMFAGDIFETVFIGWIQMRSSRSRDIFDDMSALIFADPSCFICLVGVVCLLFQEFSVYFFLASVKALITPVFWCGTFAVANTKYNPLLNIGCLYDTERTRTASLLDFYGGCNHWSTPFAYSNLLMKTATNITAYTDGFVSGIYPVYPVSRSTYRYAIDKFNLTEPLIWDQFYKD